MIHSPFPPRPAAFATKAPVHNRGARLFAALGLTAALARPAAEGIRNPAPGAFGLARSGGRFAHVQDATATTHNPANLVYLTEPEAIVAPTFVFIETELRLNTGERAETRSPWKILPNAFLASPINDRLSVGLAVTTPYGLSNEWENSGAFGPGGSLRYLAPYFAELQTVNFNPALAYKVNERLSVGVGLNVMWSELSLKQHYPWAFALIGAGVPPAVAAGFPDGIADAEGDGVGYGANVGLTWNVNEAHRLALTYRSPINIDYDGDLRISNFAGPAAAVGATPQSHFGSKIKYPDIVGVGYGVQVTDTVQIEANAEWLRFENFESLNLDVGNNAPLFAATGTNTRQNWQNTFTAGAAIGWQASDAWNLRASYHFFESPVPADTLSTTIPDANQNALTFGAAYRWRRHRAELSYSVVFYQDRRSSNAQFPSQQGEYETSVHLISASYGYRF